jgi:CheY-like chemotaxis protein
MLATNPQGQTGPQRVLVVEDDILVRLMIAEELRGAGFVVLEALNADEALTMLEGSSSIDLLMTDVMMPGSIDGLGLAAAVRSKWPRLKIVVASVEAPAWPGPGLADAFIGKPYDPARVVRWIKELLAGGDQ